MTGMDLLKVTCHGCRRHWLETPLSFDRRICQGCPWCGARSALVHAESEAR